MTKAESSDRSKDVMKLEATQPLRISLVDAEGKIIHPYPPKRRKKRQKFGQGIVKALKFIRSDRLSLIVLVVALLLIGLFLAFWVFWISFDTFVSPLWSADSGLSYIVRYSRIMAGDEQEIEITVVNENVFTLSKVWACLVFDDTLPVSTCTDGSNIIGFGNLAPNERKTRSFNMSVQRRTFCQTEAHISVLAKEIEPVNLVSPPFWVLPLPNPRPYFAAISELLLTALGGVVGLVFKRAVEYVLPEE